MHKKLVLCLRILSLLYCLLSHIVYDSESISDWEFALNNLIISFCIHVNVLDRHVGTDEKRLYYYQTKVSMVF